ncbi:MAG: glycosyltransferase [Bacteroidales bacterium]|nr:glycosyltransferase [Bacteroidales bacterium]MCM1416503.1 glycosyltransferase [bacterium]MCM1422674.1 glycosyltransferase [bacterium]
MHPISVCIIAKNEEARIEKCLSSIKPCGFEIVVVDTGSTDRTKEIAAAYADKVLDFAWCDDFSAARNFSLREASNNWIFMIDCDESVKSIDVEELNYFRKHLSDKVGSVSRENLVTENGVLTLNNTDYTERFFDRRLYRYTGIIHEQLTPVKGRGIDTLLLNTTLLHTGYDMTEEERAAKYRRNFTLLEKQAAADPDNPYLYYQLGKSCEILNDYARACTYYDKGLTFDLDPELAYVQAMVVSYGNALLRTDQAETALGFEGIYDEFSQVTDFVYLMGNIYQDNGMYEEALAQYQKAIGMPPGRQNGTNSFLPVYQCGRVFERLGDPGSAAALYGQCGDFAPAKERLQSLAQT